MKKGVVLQISKGTALILGSDGQFRRVRAKKNWVVGSVASGAALPQSRGLKYWMVQAVGAALILLTIQAGVHHYSSVPASYISIDVNPSIEISLNRLDNVISITAYNKAGADVLEGLELEGFAYTKAMSLLLESEKMAPYLEDNTDVIFAISSKDGREGELANNLNEMASQLDCLQEDASYLFGSVDWDLAKRTHELGVSAGRMALCEYIAEKGEDELSLEELTDYSTSRLIEMTQPD